MRFKSVLGAFLFIILASTVAFLVFVQTKSFGNLVTRVLTDLSQRSFKTNVKVSNFSLSLFPPGVELNQVSIQKEISPVEKFEAELGKIGFYISLLEIEEKKLTLGEVRISDSVINYAFPKKEGELKEIDQQLISRIFELSKDAPIGVDTVLIENSLITANDLQAEARRLKIFKKNKSFVARFHLSNIRNISNEKLQLDEVWGDAEITKKDIFLERLKAQQDVHTLLLKGNINNYFLLKGSEADLVGEVLVHLKTLPATLPLPKELEIRKGIAKASLKLQYKNSHLTGTSDIYVEGLRSNALYADQLKLSLSLQDQKLFLQKFALEHKDQRAKLLAPAIVLNLNDLSYLTQPIKAEVRKLSLSNALRILGPSLNPLKGILSGILTFEMNKGNLSFTPQDNFTVSGLGLVVGDKKDLFKVLMIDNVRLKNSKFLLVDNEFRMSTIAELKKSRLAVEGLVNKNRVEFSTTNAVIDLEDFGNISNLDIKGAGILSVDVSGPLKKTMINIKGFTKGFEVLGYKLGESQKDITIDLDASNVVINKMESQYGKTHISGTGLVSYDDADIALGITSSDATSADLVEILHPIFKDLDFLPSDLDFRAKVDVDIFGKYRMDDLKIKSNVRFSDFTAFGETLNSGAFNISLLNRNLTFNNLEAHKSRGRIIGDFGVHLRDKKMKLNYEWDNLELASFNFSKKLGLNISSRISGQISGGGPLSDYNIFLTSTAFNTRTPNHIFKDSNVNLEIKPKRIAGEVNLLGQIVSSRFNLALKPGIASELTMSLSTDEIKPVLVAVFGQHLETENITGGIAFTGITKFEDGFKNLNLSGHLKDLKFNHPEFMVNYSSPSPQFLVKNSNISRWNLNIKEPNIKVSTKGEGVFGKKLRLVQELNLNSKILEVLFAPILSSEGFLENRLSIAGDGTNFDFSVSSEAKGLDISIERLPVSINDLKYKLEFADRRLSIQELSTTLDHGLVSLQGDIFFDENQPDVNLKFILDKAEIPILGKSSLNATGEGIIVGNNYPYNIGGEIVLNKALIVNELNEFSSRSSGFSQIRFLPKNQESPFAKLFTLNLNVKAENPIRITNSLMDVALKGEVRVFGNPSRPTAEGRVFAAPNTSRIFFKNNEYLITSADINFNPKKEISNPDFDIQAITNISSFKVYPKAYGDLERFNFDLTSEPSLPRNSILSLIAFGYTDELQTSIKDQQSLTEVGVGSFVFDRFKISDILNKQFGLQINLGTVIEQSATDSLLAGRSQDGGGGPQGELGRTRSATKIELKKRLDDAFTLSVSSTMGGSIGQRQSMNLNYGITKNIQVEGVYELRTNEEGQSDVTGDSFGGDIKFRRTFK